MDQIPAVPIVGRATVVPMVTVGTKGEMITVGTSTKGYHANLAVNANLLKGVNTVIHHHMV